MARALEIILPRSMDLLLLVGRILLALIFLHEAITLSGGFAAAESAVSRLGISPFLLIVTIALQAGAGAMMASGWHARLGSFSLGLFCLATAFLFHSNLSNRNELLHFEKDLAIAGGLFVLTAAGAGAFSLNGLTERLSRRSRP